MIDIKCLQLYGLFVDLYVFSVCVYACMCVCVLCLSWPEPRPSSLLCRSLHSSVSLSLQLFTSLLKTSGASFPACQLPIHFPLFSRLPLHPLLSSFHLSSPHRPISECLSLLPEEHTLILLSPGQTDQGWPR